MAARAEYKDAVKDTFPTTGTGTVTCAGTAINGYGTLNANHTDGATVNYRMENADQSEWEVGQGVKSGNTLTRVTVFKSSNAGGLVSFSAGTKTVMTGPVADDLYGVPELLRASRNYYVRTDGSDSNNGLANTAGGAFLTIQHAINIAASLATTLYTATINCGTGVGSGEDLIVQGVGLGVQDTGYAIAIVGDTVTPANVTVNSIYVFGSTIKISGLKSTTDITSDFAYLSIDHCTAKRFVLNPNAVFSVGAGCTVAGSGGQAIYAYGSGAHMDVNAAITVSGTPAYTSGFVTANNGAIVAFYAQPTGSATGPRYNVRSNAVINTFGGGATWLPGNAAGTDGTGEGKYL